VLIVPLGQRRRAEALMARAGVAADWTTPPDRAEVLARELERMLADPALAPGPDEAGVATRLLAAHGPERVAAAFGRLWAAGRPAPAASSSPPAGAASRSAGWRTRPRVRGRPHEPKDGF
jgi:ATP-dependent RNA helicase DeaD